MKLKSFSIVIGVLALAVLLLMSARGIVAQGLNLPARVAQELGAAARSRLTYQGRLTSSAGAPINSVVQMVFKIYDESDTVLWTSATRTITPMNGLFTVYLGAPPDSMLDGSILANAASIGVTVGSDAEMTPRQPFNTVVGHSANQYGVVGGSDSGIGVYGSSNTGYGVYGSSGSSLGVFASSGGSGRSYPALRADNWLTTTGMAGYFTNNSVYATAQFGNTGNGQVLYLQNAYTGTTAANGGPAGGAFIQAVNGTETADLFGVSKNGNVTQARDANGLVKAGVYAYCGHPSSGGYISRSFNNVGGTITYTDGASVGHCTLDFGFKLDDRYFVATAYSGYVASCYIDYSVNNTKLQCQVNNVVGGGATDENIMVLIY